ncbi:MAG TPA: molecular chaperone TorD family protein [Burkholderiales bacterium]|nr:molecular chaperone TorD family protein [Burkholderiales bacterium]
MAESEAVSAIEPEERARALWYAVVSRLFYAPPDRALLDELNAIGHDAEPEAEESPFLATWRDLQRAGEGADPQALTEEFESLFVGVGKAPVTPYTSAYVAPNAPDRHLLALRDTLSGWGLARHERVFESEDHVSALCDTMRWLIEQPAAVEDQRAFFLKFVDGGITAFCDATIRSPLAGFYAKVCAFTAAFLDVERSAFDMYTPA